MSTRRDDTGREKAGETLRASEERFRKIFEFSNDAIFIVVPAQDKILDANPKAARMLGYTRQELLSLPISAIHPDEMPQFLAFSQAVFERGQGWTDELSCLARNGQRLPAEISASVIEIAGQPCLLALVRDISKRKSAQETLRRRNRELTLLNQIIAASATDPEPEAILETACRALALAFDLPQTAAALLNEEKTEVVVVAEYTSTGSAQLPAEERPSGLNERIRVEDNPSFQYLLNHKAPLVAEDAQQDPRLAPIQALLRKYGIVSLLIVPLIIQGEVVGSLGLNEFEPRHFSTEEVGLAWTVADQVAGALARARLAQTHQRLITAIEQSAESVIITDLEGTILYVNPAFEQISGYSGAEAVGQNLRILKSDQHAPDFYEKLWATISAGQVWHRHFVNKKKDGTLYTVDTTISPVRDESGMIVSYVSVQRDITRELELEKQYLQAQKMEAIGRLTAGVAHDFNNLLTVINGFTEMVQAQLPPEDPLQEMVGKVLASGQRATNLVRQLLAFSRKQIIEPKTLNLNEVVAEMDRMLQRLIGEDIELKTRLTPNLWPVKIDPTQIEQIIINLAVNARDAMPNGGRLIIETTNVVLDETYVVNHLEAQFGEHVLLAISDTGTGISEEDKPHIFEPFFTTKEPNKGTGLGLATVYGIVKQSGGNIGVYSEEGQGTTFKIYLPRAEETSPEPIRSAVGTELPSGTETILLVEDNPAVRDLVRRVLESQGYVVLEAEDAQEALHLASRYSGPIHLLLTDVVMPGLSGRGLVEQLSPTQPHLKVLFMSGYTDEMIAHHGVLDAEVAFLQKPFSPLALARKVRAVLDEPQPKQS